MTNIYELKNEILEKKLKKHQIYEEIYEKVTLKIKYTNTNTSDCFCMFKFKKFEFGIPKYNMEECISYIIAKLRKGKFKVGVMAQDTIIISWLHILDNQTKKEREINEKVTLLDINEQEKLKNQQQQNFLTLDNQYIQTNSHFGDTLTSFPQYDTLSSSIDYTKPLLTSSQSNSKQVKQIGYTPQQNNFSNTGNNTNNKIGKNDNSSMELDALLNEFDKGFF